MTSGEDCSTNGPATAAAAANPSALTLAQLARLLSLPEEMIRRHAEAGAPVAHDGTVNLIQYTAWLNKKLLSLGENGENDAD